MAAGHTVIDRELVVELLPFIRRKDYKGSIMEMYMFIKRIVKENENSRRW